MLCFNQFNCYKFMFNKYERTKDLNMCIFKYIFSPFFIGLSLTKNLDITPFLYNPIAKGLYFIRNV